MDRFFHRNVAAAATASEDAPAPPPPPPPPKVHYGVPALACCLAADPVQGTIAIGTESGHIKLFGRRGSELLLPAISPAPVRHLAFITNRGLLLAVHERAVLRLWSLRGARPTLAATPVLPAVDSLEVSVATLVPRSSIVLLGTSDGRVFACDGAGGRTSGPHAGLRGEAVRRSPVQASRPFCPDGGLAAPTAPCRPHPSSPADQPHLPA